MTAIQPVKSQSEKTYEMTPDWSREAPRGFWDPGRKLLKSIRDYQRAQASSSGLKKRWAVLRYRFWSAVTSCDIPLTVKIEGGLVLPHPIGIVVHPEAEIGPNCVLMQNTTLGLTGTHGGPENRRAPRLEGWVDVSTGAQVLGPVTVGYRGQVAANAVALADVPRYTIVGGIPAKPISKREGGVLPPTDQLKDQRAPETLS